MFTCEVCGANFGVEGYHVAAGGRLFDSIECALRATRTARRTDSITLWVAAGRRRLGIDDDPTNVEEEPADL